MTWGDKAMTWADKAAIASVLVCFPGFIMLYINAWDTLNAPPPPPREPYVEGHYFPIEKILDEERSRGEPKLYDYMYRVYAFSWGWDGESALTCKEARVYVWKEGDYYLHSVHLEGMQYFSGKVVSKEIFYFKTRTNECELGKEYPSSGIESDIEFEHAIGYGS